MRRPSYRSPQAKHIAIDRQIYGYDKQAKDKLDVACQSGGIQHRQEVVLDESSGIATFTGLATKGVLQRGERTDPAGEFDGCTPYRGRYMQKRDLRPSQHQESACDHEHDESEVKSDNDVGEDVVHETT